MRHIRETKKRIGNKDERVKVLQAQIGKEFKEDMNDNQIGKIAEIYAFAICGLEEETIIKGLIIKKWMGIAFIDKKIID